MTGCIIEENPQMPTRVIDVVSFQGDDDARLIHTNGMRGRYIAVSHSWGTVVKAYTTTKTLPSLKKKIEYVGLPKTFQDAIFIARKLKVHYVWIDSVCIIQDDDEDWKREATTMGLVYERAYLTISASDSPGDHAGFLIPNPEVYPEVKFPFRSDGQSLDSVYLCSMYRGYFDPRTTSISSRGWVLQERTLSRRILHFSGQQVHWECSQHRVSEDGYKEDVKTAVNTSYYLGQNIRTLTERSRTGDKSGSDPAERNEALKTLYHFYATKIHEFSTCKLTFASDKLPAGAAAGLGAHESGHLLFDEPIFVYSLLWYTEIWSVHGSGMPDKARAPFWSWAAMEGNRVFHLLGIDINAERRIFLKIDGVLEVDYQALYPYHLLECSGKPVPVVRGNYIPDKAFRSELGSKIGFAHSLEDDFQPPTGGYELWYLNDMPTSGAFGTSARGWVCFDSQELKPESCFFIPVCAPLEGKERDQPSTTRGCLGLAAVQDHGISSQLSNGRTPDAVYRRIGFGGIKQTTSFEMLHETNFFLV